MNLRLSSRALLAIAGLACAASVGLALLAQHQFNMQPCPWCILQRLIFVVLAGLCLLGAALPALPRRLVAALALPFAAGGMAAALWQDLLGGHTARSARACPPPADAAPALTLAGGPRPDPGARPAGRRPRLGTRRPLAGRLGGPRGRPRGRARPARPSPPPGAAGAAPAEGARGPSSPSWTPCVAASPLAMA